VISADLPGGGAPALLRRLRSEPAGAGTRVVVITARASELAREGAFQACDARVLRTDRDGLLRAVLGVPGTPPIVAAPAELALAPQGAEI
jgi:CheY-like chemotaxis protein